MPGNLTSQSTAIVASLITAVPMTVAAGAAWYSAHRSRREGHNDSDIIQSQLFSITEHLERQDTQFERVETNFARLDLRFDSIEDKVERHLGWHRTEAELQLPSMLAKNKESQHVRPE